MAPTGWNRWLRFCFLLAMARREMIPGELRPQPVRKEPKGIKGAALAPAKSESDYFAMCPVCGQTFDMRELDEVLHHARGPHEPMPM